MQDTDDKIRISAARLRREPWRYWGFTQEPEAWADHGADGPRDQGVDGRGGNDDG